MSFYEHDAIFANRGRLVPYAAPFTSDEGSASMTDEKSSAGDSTYQVNSHDWPLLTRAGLTLDAVFQVLASFDKFHPHAVRGLAEISVDKETSAHQER